jgi:succinate dehydrogenase/fumarate reductase cytochrome b subunit
MVITDRIRNIILSPKTEWAVIDTEQDTPGSLLKKYIIPLLVLGSVAVFIGYGIIGMDALFFKIKGFRWGAWFAIRQFLSGLIGFYVATYVIDALAPSFSSEKNLHKSAQLVAYASTPSWVAALFLVLPSLGILGLFGLYGIYLFYIGLPVLKKTPEDKRVGYMVIAALVIILVSWVAQWLIGMVLNPVLGDPYAGSVQDLKQIFGQ